MVHEDDLEMIADRIWPALELLIGFLAESVQQEHERYAQMGIDPASDAATFAANVRQRVFNKMRPHLPMPAKAPMSPLHLDLAPYRLKVLHADQGDIPRPKTAARRAFYRLNELGVMAMNIPVCPLVEIDEKILAVEEGSLALVWSSDGPDLVQADLYRPPLNDFPGRALDLLDASEVVEDDDFPEIRKDGEDTSGESAAATGTDGNVVGDANGAGPQDGPDEPEGEEDQDKES